MRIIAGQYRGRPLSSLRGAALRPTSDRLRETLFDVLTAGRPDALAGSVWFDLYAGSGAVGLEALSRGAHTVYFVESARAAQALIRHNLERLGIEEGCTLMARDALAALRQLEKEGVACDFCFLDPPWEDHGAYRQALEFLSRPASSLLKPSSLVVVEHQQRFDPGESFGALGRYRRLPQGDAALSFYRLP